MDRPTHCYDPVSRLWPTVLLASSLLCATAAGQQPFVDDAQRQVSLPANVNRVFAAGAPAEVLLYTLVPDKLAGRNLTPPAASLELIPPQFRNPTAIVNLPDRDDPRYDAELLALDVDVYVDYGAVDADYVAALEAISERTRIPGIILDGRLTAIPDVYRRLGAAFGVAERGARLADEAQRLIDKYQGMLGRAPLRVYLACSQNGLTPCFAGHSAGEVADLLGAVNVAGRIDTAARRPLTIAEIRDWAPDVVVAASPAAAAAIRSDPAWQAVTAVAAGRVHAAPTLPFNWGPRPPSVNRVAGLIWMAYALPGRAFDAAYFDDVRSLFATFYHVTPSTEQLRALTLESN